MKLGLLPGAGGTQRLPRIVGARAAADMIVSGNPVTGAAAAAMGLVDRSMAGDLVAEAASFALQLAAGMKWVPVRNCDDRLEADRLDRSAFERHAHVLLTRSRGLDSPKACVEAVRASIDLPFEEGLTRERELFTGLVGGVQSRAQRHLFFAEREAAKVPGIDRDMRPRAIATAAVRRRRHEVTERPFACGVSRRSSGGEAAGRPRKVAVLRRRSARFID